MESVGEVSASVEDLAERIDKQLVAHMAANR